MLKLKRTGLRWTVLQLRIEMPQFQSRLTLQQFSFLLTTPCRFKRNIEKESKLTYCMMHPVILSSKHPLTKLMIQTEHVRLLHAGPTLLMSSLNCRYHIVGGKKVVHSIARACVTCRHETQKPKPQMMGQLPIERVIPDIVFENVGVDYVGPIYTKYGHVRKPTVVKTFACLCCCL